MRPAPPDKLGSEFWFSLFMITLGLASTIFGLIGRLVYPAFGGCLIVLIYVHRLVQHVRAVRLGRRLKLDPELARLYYGRKN